MIQTVSLHYSFYLSSTPSPYIPSNLIRISYLDGSTNHLDTINKDTRCSARCL